MTTIKDLKFETHPIGEGIQAVIEFDNGYGASVISGTRYFYSTPDRPYEIAVLHNGHIVYDTPITNDVCGYLTEDEANAILAQIEALPEKRYAVYKSHLGIDTECFTPFPYLSKVDAESEKDKLNTQYHYPYAGTEFVIVEMDVNIYPEAWVNPSPTL